MKMECSRRRLSAIFGATLFITTVFVLTSFYELPRNIFHRVLKNSFGNSSILYNVESSSDVWGSGGSTRRYGNQWKPPPMSKRTTKTFPPRSKVITGLSALPTQRAFSVLLGHVSTSRTEVLPPPSFTAAVGVQNVSRIPKKRNRSVLTKRFPDAIIIGVKKGGTRALLQFLSIHSRIKIAKKEIHFFDKDFNYEKGLSWYKDQMPLSYSNETVMEKTPGYFVAKLAPERIYDMNPSVKLIVTFRDPTRRSISDYAQSLDKAAVKGRRKRVKPFVYKMFKDKKGKILNTDNSKLSIGMYAVHLKRWLAVFPRKQMHFISGENLVKRPWEELFTVQKFLNLPSEITKADFVLNKTKGFYCLRWKKGKRGGTKEGHCLNEGKGRKHPYVDMTTVRTLQDFFRPLNNELYKLTGRNFSWP